MNIYDKMSRITLELQTVSKNLSVGYGKNSYKAVGERDILDAVKPMENKYGIFSYPYDREIIESQTLHGESEYNGTVKHTTTFFSRMKTVYRFVNIEAPEEFIDIVSYSEGIDSQDKGSGKAMTYADKYALMKAYKISTGDDPDQNASEPTNYTKSPLQTKRQPEKPKTISKDKAGVLFNKLLEYAGTAELAQITMLDITGKNKTSELTEEDFTKAMTEVQARIDNK